MDISPCLCESLIGLVELCVQLSEVGGRGAEASEHAYEDGADFGEGGGWVGDRDVGGC